MMTYDQDIVLDVCCRYPTKREILNVKKSGAKKLIVRGGHFPSIDQIKTIESIGIEYEILLSEVFPSDQNIIDINNSKISQLIIFSKDFPYLGEVQAFNKFSKNVRFNMTKGTFPTMEHMIVIRQFKPEITVGFYNKVPPGPGYANFFNDLNTKKVFVITEQFPYGMDAVGLNMLTNSRVEIMPEERLMSQDVPIINEIKLSTIVNLKNPYPVNNEFISLVKKVHVDKITIEDSGDGDLMSPRMTEMIENSFSPVTIKFFDFY